MTDVEALLRAAGDALAVPLGPLPDLVGRLPARRPRVDLDHLHLLVRDLDASASFYGQWFGLEGDVIDGTLFARNAEGFLLCLTPASQPTRLGDAHFGFTMPSVDTLRMLRDAMVASGVKASDVNVGPGHASFHVRDPDDNDIE